MRLKRAQEWKEKSNENTTKEKKDMETQLLEVQENLVEVLEQFQKCKKQNDNSTK